MQCDDFQNFLVRSGIIPKNKAKYYGMWISRFFSDSSKTWEDNIEAEDIDRFAINLGKQYEDRGRWC